MIKVFDYIEQLDCFKINDEFKSIADLLGLTEWSEVVWIGRYFMLDNDYGEHWFDNWDEREALEEKAFALGYKSEFLFIINPRSFINNKDGPCHTDEERKFFWTDVCKSLALSFTTIFAEARKNNLRQYSSSAYIPGLEERIEQVQLKYLQK